MNVYNVWAVYPENPNQEIDKEKPDLTLVVKDEDDVVPLAYKEFPDTQYFITDLVGETH